MQEVIDKIWRGYANLLIGYAGLEKLEEAAWQNSTGRNMTDYWIDGTCSNLFQSGLEHGVPMSRSEVVLEVSMLSRKHYFSSLLRLCTL